MIVPASFARLPVVPVWSWRKPLRHCPVLIPARNQSYFSVTGYEDDRKSGSATSGEPRAAPVPNPRPACRTTRPRARPAGVRPAIGTHAELRQVGMDVDPAWTSAHLVHRLATTPAWSRSPPSRGRASTTRATSRSALFYAVRDGFRYDPYNVDHAPEAFRASSVVDVGVELVRAEVGAADRRRPLAGASPPASASPTSRNHLTSEKLKAQMSTDVFAWHGYSELLLDDGWHKLSTAFNIELCDRFGVKALEFDGTGDALMHPFDKAGRRHMEYVRQRGCFDDLPARPRSWPTFAEIYGDGMIDGRTRGRAAPRPPATTPSRPEPAARQRAPSTTRASRSRRAGARARGRRGRPARSPRRRPTPGQAGPHDVAGRVRRRARRIEVLAAVEERQQPARGRAASPRCSMSS